MKKLAVVMMLCAVLSMAGVSGCASGNGNTAKPSADSVTPEPAGKEAEQDSETTPVGAEQENKSAQEQEPGQKDVTDQGSSSSGKEGTAADGKAAELQLTEAGKEFLRKMCYCLPEFSDPAEMDGEFWHEFIFLSYTGAWGDEEIEEVTREDLQMQEKVVKVSLEDMESYVKLALGVDLPDYKPAFEDMSPGQTSCFYRDGYYYIGLSDFPDFTFTYQDGTLEGDDIYIVKYNTAFEGDENAGSVVFRVRPADNANGFVIVGKTVNR